MAGQQQEEIETIRSRTIEVKLSDADVKRISEKAAAHLFDFNSKKLLWRRFKRYSRFNDKCF